MWHRHIRNYRVVQKADPLFQFCDNFCKCTPILTIFFTVTTRNLQRTQVKLRWTPHDYYVITLPRKTHATPKINAIFANARCFEVYSKQ